MESKDFLSKQEFVKSDVIANLFSLSVRRIQQLTQDGVLHTEDTQSGRRYNLVPTIQEYVKHLQDKANGRTTNKGKEAELKEQKLEAEIELKESQAKLHQLKTQIAEGKYKDVEEIKIDYRRFFIIFKKFAISIPSRVTGYINGVVDATQVRVIEKDLDTEINNLLNGFVIAGVTQEEMELEKAKKTAKKKVSTSKRKAKRVKDA